jgi:hypothetical protein
MRPRFAAAWFTCCVGFWLAGEVQTKAQTTEDRCADALTAAVVLDGGLDSDFFRSKLSSYPWHIIEHDDGHLEDTIAGGPANRKTVSKIEHTASCISTHQGEHLMSFCDATQRGKGVDLVITGGMPAYASMLMVKIDEKKQITCSFEATYPMTIPGENIQWRITKKALQIKNEEIKAGTRLYGWLSVEFEEITTLKAQTTRKTYKIEGHVNPVIQAAATQL